MAAFMSRVKSGWNAFKGRDPTSMEFLKPVESGSVSSSRPDRMRFTGGNLRSIVSKVYNKIAVDVTQINFNHVRLDDDGNFKEIIDSTLNNCLTIEANLDQSGKALIQDIVQSLFDEGCIAIVPTDTDEDPNVGKYDVLTLRVGKILEWYPNSVKVRVYNQDTGRYSDIFMKKSACAIIENPFYAIMNEPNSTAQRLIKTINSLNKANEQTTSGKLDLIFQLPYVIKNEQKKAEAKKRKADLEDQLDESKHGIAYVDATEHVTQLNRSIDNSLWEQVKELTRELYNELGLTQAILDGSASEEENINYFNGSIAPVCDAIVDGMTRIFLTKTAITQKQRVVYYRDPFKLVPVSQLADIADKFRRNEIMKSNEIRSKIGLKPLDDEKANDLSNPNINKSNEELTGTKTKVDPNIDVQNKDKEEQM